MIVEKINQTDWANIYGVYENNRKEIGVVEVVLGGKDCGTYYYSLTGRYTKKDIKKFFNKYREY